MSYIYSHSKSNALKDSSYDKTGVIKLDGIIGYSHNPFVYTLKMDILIILKVDSTTKNLYDFED